MAADIVATPELCAHCFDCLAMYFSRGSMPPAPSPYDVCGVECPMFVTLYKMTARGKELRGCIGTLSPVSITNINDYVFKSAFEDTRFAPLLEEEVPALEISFSLLVMFEQAATSLDWELEVHGIRINFVHDRRRYSATYLPGVALEQGWTKEETLISLVRKAGYKGERSVIYFQSLLVMCMHMCI